MMAGLILFLHGDKRLVFTAIASITSLRVLNRLFSLHLLPNLANPTKCWKTVRGVLVMKFAVSTYSLQREITSGRMTQLDAVFKIRELGADAVEFVDVYPPEGMTRLEYARRLGEACQEAGLSVSNYTTGADFLLNPVRDEVQRLQEELQLAAALGAKSIRHDVTLGIPGDEKGYTGFTQVLPRLAEGCREVTERAQAMGISTMVENHGYFFQDVDRVEALLTTVGHPNFGLLFDMGNFFCADVQPDIALGRLVPYVRYVHAKDMFVKPGTAPCPGEGFIRSRGGRFLRLTIIGHGDVPVTSCLSILKTAGYDGALGIEFEGIEDCLQGISIGLSNLRRFVEMV